MLKWVLLEQANITLTPLVLGTDYLQVNALSECIIGIYLHEFTNKQRELSTPDEALRVNPDNSQAASALTFILFRLNTLHKEIANLWVSRSHGVMTVLYWTRDTRCDKSLRHVAATGCCNKLPHVTCENHCRCDLSHEFKLVWIRATHSRDKKRASGRGRQLFYHGPPC